MASEGRDDRARRDSPESAPTAPAEPTAPAQPAEPSGAPAPPAAWGAPAPPAGAYPPGPQPYPPPVAEAAPARRGRKGGGDVTAVREPAPFSQVLGRVMIVVLLVLLVVFAVRNLQPVEFDYLFGKAERSARTAGGELSGGVPLIYLLVAGFAFGFVTGAYLVWRRQRAQLARSVREMAERERQLAAARTPPG